LRDDRDALDQVAFEIYGAFYDELSEREKMEVEAELDYRDSLGWRS
jgi:hypothetical protein